MQVRQQYLQGSDIQMSTLVCVLTIAADMLQFSSSAHTAARTAICHVCLGVLNCVLMQDGPVCKRCLHFLMGCASVVHLYHHFLTFQNAVCSQCKSTWSAAQIQTQSMMVVFPWNTRYVHSMQGQCSNTMTRMALQVCILPSGSHAGTEGEVPLCAGPYCNSNQSHRS